jgi:hypothetical protein
MLRTSGGFLTVSQKRFLGESEVPAMIVLDAILCSFLARSILVQPGLRFRR